MGIEKGPHIPAVSRKKQQGTSWGSEMNNAQKVVIALYLLLLIFCAALIFASNAFLSLEAGKTVLPIAADGFKVVLGAIVGALSAILGTMQYDQERNGE